MLPFKMQAMALCSLRGCDGTPKNDPHKPIARYLRTFLLRPADPNWRTNIPRTTFFGDQPTHEELKLFWDSLDQYPTHFFVHLLHAAELIGYLYASHEQAFSVDNFPERLETQAKFSAFSDRLKDEQSFWLEFYRKGCDKLHMNPETYLQFSHRLRDAPHEEDAPQGGMGGDVGGKVPLLRSGTGGDQ